MLQYLCIIIILIINNVQIRLLGQAELAPHVLIMMGCMVIQLCLLFYNILIYVLYVVLCISVSCSQTSGIFTAESFSDGFIN